MKLNSLKTKILVCVKNSKIIVNVNIDCTELKQIKKMVYFESKITSNGDNIREIKHRIAMEKVAFCKKYNLFTLKNIQLNTNKRLT